MRYYLKSLALYDTQTAVVDGVPVNGVHTRIVRTEESDEAIWQAFGRRGCCLKIFKRPYTGLDMTWGDAGATIVEATIVQNMAAMRGLAPRVYGLARLCDPEGPGVCHVAQVTDYVVGEHGYSVDLRKRLGEFQREIGFDMRWDMNLKNARGDLWTDWGFWRMSNPQRYEARLRDLATERADWGSRSDAYQSALGCPAQRDFVHRLEVMKLRPQHVRYRTLLDVGCNLGNFVRWAEEHGARRAWGIELPHVAEVAREVANWCRAWNADIVGVRLPKDNDVMVGMIQEVAGRERFDVVLALAVERQIGYGPWMRELVRPGGYFWLEGHVPDKRETYEERLLADWDEVEFLGTTRDHGPRPIFKCKGGT